MNPKKVASKQICIDYIEKMTINGHFLYNLDIFVFCLCRKVTIYERNYHLLYNLDFSVVWQTRFSHCNSLIERLWCTCTVESTRANRFYRISTLVLKLVHVNFGTC